MSKTLPFLQSLIFKILFTVSVVTIIGLGILLYLIIETERKNILAERVRASELVAQPILYSIYEDMLNERADMARYLIAGLKTIPGVERVQVIRNNGVDEAFQNLDTIKEMESRLGSIRPEWIKGHATKADVRAEGIDTPEFKEAVEYINAAKGKSRYYTEQVEGQELLTYIALIEVEEGCVWCHGEAESARGFLMISTSLKEPYALIKQSRNRWLAYGSGIIIAISIVFLILLRTVLSKRMEQMTRISGEWGRGNLDVRMPASKKDELGMLAVSFNSMADSLKLHEEEIVRLYENMHRAKVEWERTFDSMDEMVLITDNNGIILRGNWAVARRLLTPFSEILGKSCFELFGETGKGELSESIKKTIDTKVAQTVEIEAPDPGGSLWVTSRPLSFNKNNEVATIIHVMTDVTALKKLTRLEEEKKRLEATDEFRGSLMSIVSHELRTHLTTIMGYIDLVRNRDVDEETKDEWLEIIHNESNRITGFMDEILDLTQTEALVELKKEDFDIVRLIKEIAEPFILRTTKHSFDIETSGKTINIYGNIGKISNIITNLIENAIKYSPEGGKILIKAEASDTGSIISVSDDGVGIPISDIKKVFNPFHRVDSDQTIAIKGTGLGLSICKAIIELHGGSIWAESQGEGKGSTIYFSLPSGKAKKKADKRPDKP